MNRCYEAMDSLSSSRRRGLRGNDGSLIQAERGRPMKMAGWITKLDDFLKLGDHDLLTHAGKISAEQAKEKAHLEYDGYRKVIDLEPTRVDKDLEAAIRNCPGRAAGNEG